MKLILNTIFLLAMTVLTYGQTVKIPTLNEQAPIVVSIVNHHVFNRFNYEGRVLVLEFWATWCAPCIGGFPHMNTLVERFAHENIIFAAISNEPDERIKVFFKRTNKRLDALHLVDDGTTWSKYNITTIPHCVVIDKENVIRWIGNSKDLTEDILHKILVTKPDTKLGINPSTEELILKQESAYKDKPLFLFKLNINDAPSSPKTSSARSSANMGLVNFNKTNASLGDLLLSITDIGGKNRIISTDSTKIKKTYDLHYNTISSINDTSTFRTYENKYIPKSPRSNYLLHLLSDALNFKLEIVERQQEVYTLVVSNEKRLKSFESLQKVQTSSSGNDYYPQLEIVGYSLKDLATEMERVTQNIIICNNINITTYDVSLNLTNLETLNKSLNFQGLKLVRTRVPVKLLKIDFLN